MAGSRMKSYLIRLPEEQAEMLDAVASFRGETVTDTFRQGLRVLIRLTFEQEMKNNPDLLLRKLPREIRLKDVLRAFSIEEK